MQISLPTGAPRAAQQKIRILCILVFLSTIWLLMRGYQGLTGDAQLYAFQALARIFPNLAADLYLRNTSQDKFTIFSCFYAFFIEIFGVEKAARLLTLVISTWLLAAAWSLARALGHHRNAWLATAFIMILPSDYGASGVFHFTERFLTARLMAEALIVTALACHFLGKRRLALLIACGSLFVHPLIALPGLLVLLCLWLPLTTSALTAMACVIAVLGLAAAASYSHALGGVFVVMDNSWLEVVRERSQFLLLQIWSTRDWDLNLRPFLYLAFTSIVVEDARIRKLCLTAIVVGVAGLAIALIASLVGPIALLVQGQAWRWVWIAGFTATMLLPITIFAVWREATCGPLCVILLIVGWAEPASAAGVVLSLAIWTQRSHIGCKTARLARWIAGLLAVGVLAWALARSWTIVESPASQAQHLRDIFALRIPALLLTLIVWRVVQTSRTSWGPVLTCAMLAALAASVWPLAFKSRATFDPRSGRKEFPEWINAIPSTSSVLVAPQRDVGEFVWFELGRPNYLSVDQSSGVVFSRATALEIKRRSEVLLPLMDPSWKIRSALRASATNGSKAVPSSRPLTAANLVEVCRDPELGFVLAPQDVGFDPLRHERPDAWKGWNLYDCGRVRLHPAVSP